MVWPLTSSQADTSTTSNASAVTNVDPKKYENSIYMHLPGVTGSVTETGYEGWIKVDSFQWGTGLGISSGRWRDDDNDEEEEEQDENTYKEHEISDASLSAVTMSKKAGPESTMMLFNTLTKKAYDKITIRFVKKYLRSTIQVLIPVMEYRLYHTLISGFSTGTGGGSYGHRNNDDNSSPTESISLNFGGLEFVMYSEEGKPSEAVHYHLDTCTSTLKKGEELEVIEVKRKEKKGKKSKKDEKVAESVGEEAKDGEDKEVKEDAT